jgi:hypothetical protein
MKTSLILLSAILIFSSCKKDDSPENTTPPDQESYVNTTAGSSWSYHQTDIGSNSSSDYTITSTGNDTTINSRKYNVYSYSYGGNGYRTVDGHEYYQYDSIPIPGGIKIERLYLNDGLSKGKTWTQDFSLNVSGIPVPVTVLNEIAEKGISMTVNSTAYSDVIHVKTTLSSTIIPSNALISNIDSYYAPDYGLIENTTSIQLNYQSFVEDVNLKTELTSSDLK